MTLYVLLGIVVVVLISAIVYFVASSQSAQAIIRPKDPSLKEVREATEKAESKEESLLEKQAKELANAPIDIKIASINKLIDAGRKLRK